MYLDVDDGGGGSSKGGVRGGHHVTRKQHRLPYHQHIVSNVLPSGIAVINNNDSH